MVIVDGAVAVTGALVAAARQAQLLAGDVETVLVLPRGHRVQAQSTAGFAQVIDLPIVALRKSLLSILIYLPALVIGSILLLREMRRLRCERLQLNDFNLLHGAVLRLLGFRGRIVTYVRIDPARFGIAGRIWLAAARWSSTEIVTVSRFIARQMPPGRRSTQIYDAINVITRPPKITCSQFLFVGNYIQGKGQDSAIRAFHQIAPQFPEAELVFHGSDMNLRKNAAYRSNLQRLAAGGVGGSRIHLRGFVEDTTALYRNAAVALNFSNSESFSLTCLEASAHGLAIVATRCGGPEEIVEDGVTGFLVPVGDVNVMAARMSDLIREPARAASMGLAGQQLVTARFGVKQFRRQMMEILDLH